MGASLDTPATCPLCNELTRDPVVLKCNHRFCQRCIGDLWSVVPNGPYHCPEWRCKTVYHTLPFDNSLIRRKPSPSPRPSPRSSAGPTLNNDQTTLPDSGLGRPSLSSRLLGKRKASAPVGDVPVPKRSSLFPNEKSNDSEPPGIASSDNSGVETVIEVHGDSPVPSTSTAESSEASDSNSASVNAVQEDPSISFKTGRQSEDVIILDQSDNEVDICHVPLPASPKTVAQNHTSPKQPAATPSSSPAISTPRKNDSDQVSQRPSVFSAHRVAPTDSTDYAASSPRKNKQIPCNYCPKLAYQFAVKTCLVCGASMCTEHLRPHLDQPVFQNHTLVPPVEDTSAWRCQEHQEMNRIYCRQCGVCVCTVCTVIGSHRDHVCISIRDAERELRGNLKEEIRQLQEAEHQVRQRVDDLMQKKDCFEMMFCEASSGVKLQYGAIREALEQEEQLAQQCVAQEEKRVLGGLETKLSHLQSSLHTIQQGLHSLEALADAKGDKRIQDQAFIMEYSKVTQAASATGSFVDQFEAPDEINQARLQCLQKWTEKRLDSVVLTMPGKDRDLYRLLYGTAPVLDEDSAHPKLRLSDDKRTVTYSESQQAYTDHESRFTSFPQILALTSLDSGRWYWEVKVSVDDGRWKVGVSEGQIERKGQKDTSRLGFNSYSWCLACDKRKVEALHNKVVAPVIAERLERVGIFIDFEEGSLSFFNSTPGGSLVLMHSFKHQFSNPVFPAFSVSKTNVTVSDLFLP